MGNAGPAKLLEVPEIMTETEAAAYLRMSPRKLWGLARDGIVKSIKAGRQKRYRRIDLDAYMESLVRQSRPAKRSA